MSDAAEVWRQKSDEELQRAVGTLNDYTKEYQEVILAELSRRSGFHVGVDDEESEARGADDFEASRFENTEFEDSQFENTEEEERIIRGERRGMAEPPPTKRPIDDPKSPVVNRSADAYRYRVVPFAASVGTNEGAAQAAAQLESLIKSWSDNGWEYVRLDSVETYVAGSAGCFGLGAVPAQLVSYSMAVFKH